MNTDMFEMSGMFEHASQFFDLFHYHYGLSIFPQFRDIELLHELGKPMVMHHWGNDVRFESIAKRHNRYVNTEDSPEEEKIDQALQTLSRYISDAIVQDYEVLPYVEPYYERVHVIPIALDIKQFTPVYPQLNKKMPMVIHAPTNTDFKGTNDIEKAIRQLKQERSFQYVRVEKMSHEEAVKLYQQADIIIDQILCGSFGLLSVEAMAYGKPVIAYIREDLAARSDTPPIHNANPDTIYDVLKLLLDDPELRLSSGVAGRKYAEQHHDGDVVVKQLLDVYQIAMNQGPVS